VSYTSFEPGDLLNDRYIIQRILHVSGMGTLYEANDRDAPLPHQSRAIKESIFSSDNAQGEFDNFSHKAQILTSLSHPGLPRTFDHFVLDDRAYLVTELVEGHDLETVLFDTSAEIPVTGVHQWAIELCDTLHHLHTHQPEPLIFRDVKPANIMIDRRLNARLVDFDTLAVFSRSHGPYEPLGTDGYAAPEQYVGEVTPSIDIYGLGATLHHLLTRRDPRLEPPFSFAKRPIVKFNPDVPDALVKIVMRAVEYHPWDRFFTIEEMGLELKQLKDIG
jgi:serine/threonine protein kinase